MMAVARRLFAGAAVQTTLASSVSSGDLTINIVANTGWPTGAEEFFAVIDPDQANEEKVLVTRSGTTLSAASTGKRGVDGTVASSHAAGAVIYPCITATDLDEANQAAARLASGTTGQVVVASADPSGFSWLTFDVNAANTVATALTTKGDLLAYSTSPVRLPVGADNEFLVADSTAAAGVKWVPSVLRSTNEQTANYTLVLADAGKIVEMNSSGNLTLTIPNNSSVAFPVGTQIDLLRTNSGTVTVQPDGGVTLNSVDSYRSLASVWSVASLVKRGTNSWVLLGDLDS
jgi:hypothetical protein